MRTKWKDKLTLTNKQLQHGPFLRKKCCVNSDKECIVIGSILEEYLTVISVFQFFGYLKYFKI